MGLVRAGCDGPKKPALLVRIVMCVNTLVKVLVRNLPDIPYKPELASQAPPELVGTQRSGLV